MKTPKTRSRWLIAAAVVGSVLAALAAGVLLSNPNPAVAQAREESVTRLASAATPEALEEVVGRLGIIFHLADRSWIAVRYVDQHSGSPWSSAVALDSRGRWYHSEVHFCGQFQIYQAQWAQTLEVLGHPGISREEKKGYLDARPLQPAELRDLEESPDLDRACEKLLDLGFRPLEIERSPRLTGPWPEPFATKQAIIRHLLTE